MKDLATDMETVIRERISVWGGGGKTKKNGKLPTKKKKKTKKLTEFLTKPSFNN